MSGRAIDRPSRPTGRQRGDCAGIIRVYPSASDLDGAISCAEHAPRMIPRCCVRAHTRLYRRRVGVAKFVAARRPAQCTYRSIARHVKFGCDLPSGSLTDTALSGCWRALAKEGTAWVGFYCAIILLPTDTALPRVPNRTRAGRRVAADVEMEVDKKYHFCWFTAKKNCADGWAWCWRLSEQAGSYSY